MKKKQKDSESSSVQRETLGERERKRFAGQQVYVREDGG
jgi:hypothetical protein